MISLLEVFNHLVKALCEIHHNCHKKFQFQIKVLALLEKLSKGWIKKYVMILWEGTVNCRCLNAIALSASSLSFNRATIISTRINEHPSHGFWKRSTYKDQLNLLTKTGRTIFCRINQNQALLNRNVKRGRNII